MPLPPGAVLGTYIVVGPLGAGGMGEVYRARDTNLKREVAIKVLPDSFAQDAERIARLGREAEALASVNHSHIAAIYDFVQTGPSPFLVMELIEGETLAERIARAHGPLPRAEALDLALQIAEALEAAHDKGIIHRDLKPANIKITPDGHVKVLDFGLAKAGPLSDLGRDQSTMMQTQPGVILGTAAYMSPERAKGLDADRGADVWAFACVLFEMLSGHRAFDGETASDIIAEVLKAEPDWHRLPADTPVGIRRLLTRSLQKDPKRRLRDIRDARLEIADVQSGAATAPVVHAASRRRERTAWIAALATVTVIAGVFATRAFRSVTPAPELRLEINAVPSTWGSVAISPDGTMVVFVGRGEGSSQLWLRSFDSSTARPLPGTERGLAPFWSPDSRSIGFFAGTKLKRLAIEGGPARELATAAVPLGGSWGRDGTILFANNPGGPILRIPAEGGVPVAVTTINPAQRGHTFPSFLPDGRHFLFLTTGSGEGSGGYVGQLGDMNVKRLVATDAPPVYLPTGYLLMKRGDRLLAQAFDPDRIALSGEAFPVVEGINGGAYVSVSESGRIAYRTVPPGTAQHQFQWVDRAGNETRKVVYDGNAAIGPALSRDGRRIAVYREVNGNMDIWSYEIARQAWDRITSDPGDDIFPMWSPDGARMAFGGVRKTQGVVQLFAQNLNAASGREEQPLTARDGFPTDWSADGRFVLYQNSPSSADVDLLAMPMQGDGKPIEVVRTEFNESQGQFSPDGKWVAYQSDKTGRDEIYLRPFPGPSQDTRVSIEGGSQPRWNPDGKELFYVGGDDRMMSAPVQFSAAAVTVGTPAALFATNIGSSVTLVYRQQYMVTPDGKSFILNSHLALGTASPIFVIINWKAPK